MITHLRKHAERNTKQNPLLVIDFDARRNFVHWCLKELNAEGVSKPGKLTKQKTSFVRRTSRTLEGEDEHEAPLPEQGSLASEVLRLKELDGAARQREIEQLKANPKFNDKLAAKLEEALKKVVESDEKFQEMEDIKVKVSHAVNEKVAAVKAELSGEASTVWNGLQGSFGVVGTDESPDVRVFGGLPEMDMIVTNGVGHNVMRMIQKLNRWRMAREGFIEAAKAVQLGGEAFSGDKMDVPSAIGRVFEAALSWLKVTLDEAKEKINATLEEKKETLSFAKQWLKKGMRLDLNFSLGSEEGASPIELDLERSPELMAAADSLKIDGARIGDYLKSAFTFPAEIKEAMAKLDEYANCFGLSMSELTHDGLKSLIPDVDAEMKKYINEVRHAPARPHVPARMSPPSS